MSSRQLLDLCFDGRNHLGMPGGDFENESDCLPHVKGFANYQHSVAQKVELWGNIQSGPYFLQAVQIGGVRLVVLVGIRRWNRSVWKYRSRLRWLCHFCRLYSPRWYRCGR